MDVTNASEWAGDNARGRAEAEAILEALRIEKNPTLLGKAVKRMIEGGEYGGFEVGFFHAIGVQLL